MDGSLISCHLRLARALARAASYYNASAEKKTDPICRVVCLCALSLPPFSTPKHTGTAQLYKVNLFSSQRKQLCSYLAWYYRWLSYRPFFHSGSFLHTFSSPASSMSVRVLPVRLRVISRPPADPPPPSFSRHLLCKLLSGLPSLRSNAGRGDKKI